MEERALSQNGPGLPPETWREQFVQVLTLSVPAILAQISSMAMQYIDAAMVGSLGAKRPDLARRFSRTCVLLAVALMTLMGALMFWFAPAVFALLTPDPAVRTLGVQVLRIEAFAEPLYAVSIASAGAMRGAGRYGMQF